MDNLIRIIADWLMVPLVLVAFYAFIFIIPRAKWKFWSLRIVMAGATTYLAAKLIGLIYQPEVARPFEKLGVDPGAAYMNNPGFPSDHALFAMFLTLAVWFSTRNFWLGFSMLVMTLVIALGRVLALVHTPIDVIGGLVVAFVGILWYGRKQDKIVQ